MKRSTLIMTTAILAGTIFLAGCEDSKKPEALSFKSMEQCMYQRPLDQNELDWEKICEDAMEAAQKEHERTAPRYAPSGSDGDDLCEQEHGDDACYERKDADGNSFWTPFLAGYVVSSMLNNNGQRIYHYSKSQPMYYSKGDRKMYTASGGYAATTFGRSSVSRSAVSPVRSTPKLTTPVSIKSTGGFGRSATAARGGSFGG